MPLTFEIETLVALKIIAGSRPASFARGEIDNALVLVPRQQRIDLMPVEAIEGGPIFNAARLEFLELMFHFGALGNALYLSRFPAPRGLEQVAQLANRPVVQRIRGGLRVPVRQHVLAQETAIVRIEYRQPWFVAAIGVRFVVLSRGIIDRVRLGACTFLQPGSGGSITGHHRGFERIVRFVRLEIATGVCARQSL